MKKSIICSIILTLMLLLAACDTQNTDNPSTSMPNDVSDEVTHTQSPENPEKSNEAGEDKIENNMNVEQPSTTPLETESTISLEDEDNARDAAVSYYKKTAFAGRVTELARITNNTEFESYIPDDVKINTVIAFETTISDSAAPPRVILLIKGTNGEWTVINEGY